MTVPSAISLSADSGEPTSLGHRREEPWPRDSGDSFIYDSEVSYIFDKRSNTFTDEPDIWSESVLTGIDSGYGQSEKYAHPEGQHIRKGSDLKIPPLLLPNLHLPFLHCVRKTPRHTDLSIYVCEAFDYMDFDMIMKNFIKLMQLLDSRHKSKDIYPSLVFKSNLVPFASEANLGIDVALQLPSQFIARIDTYPKNRNEIEAAGYAFIEPPPIWDRFSYQRIHGPNVTSNTDYDQLCIDLPAYARKYLRGGNGSFLGGTKLNVMQYKCTVKHVQSEYSPFLWRYTFKSQERYLIEHLNNLQWKCLISMGILLLGKHAVLDNEVLCMSLFYTIERLAPKIWNKRENYLGCLIECLCTLSQFMENSFVPNFFWPTNNILLETISTGERKRIVAEITYIVENPFEAFFKAAVGSGSK